MGKSTISMAIFNSYVSLPEGSVDDTDRYFTYRQASIPANGIKSSRPFVHPSSFALCCRLNSLNFEPQKMALAAMAYLQKSTPNFWRKHDVPPKM